VRAAALQGRVERTKRERSSEPWKGLKGVSRADVSFREREARVAYDPAQVGIEQLIEAVSGAGFRASVKHDPK
jgi:hypothetical protein